MTKFEKKRIQTAILEKIYNEVENIKKYNYSPFNYDTCEYDPSLPMDDEMKYANEVIDEVTKMLEKML